MNPEITGVEDQAYPTVSEEASLKQVKVAASQDLVPVNCFPLAQTVERVSTIKYP